MDKDKQISEEQLNAFLDGELDAEETSRVYSESERSAELDQRLCQQRKLKELVQHAYKDVPQPVRVKASRRMQSGLLSKAMVASILLVLGATIGFFAERQISRGSGSEILTVAAVSVPVVNGQNYLLHVVSGDPEQMLAALQKAQQLIDSAGPGQINQVEVVANQKGLNLLRSDITPFADEIHLLQERDVVFYACSRTIELLEEDGVDVYLVPDAQKAYTALDRVVIRMQDDWEYIKI